MALPAFETNLNIIQQLEDEPNDVGGLTAAELKAKFDEAGLTIQTWINETLLPAMIAANLAFAKTTDIPAETVQAAIENIQEQLKQTIVGAVPNGSVNYIKLATDVTTILTTLQTGLSQALEGKAAKVHAHTKADITDLTFDAAPTENSQNPVTSGGIYAALLGIKTATQYTGTLLASGWSEDSHGYQAQTITITGLKASYDVDPQWDVALSGTDPDADAALLEGFALIHNYTTGANSLTAQCIGSAPTVNIPVKVVVFG